MSTTMAKRQNGSPSVSIENVVSDVIQNSFRRFFDDNFWGVSNPLTTGAVPLNVRETGQHFELDVIAPGCKKEDFKINVSDNTLTISYESKLDSNKQQENEWVRNEFVQRSFNTSFNLDDSVDVTNISAAYTDGILHITLPKNEKAKKLSRNIEVK
jgi:HSP20 family protein